MYFNTPLNLEGECYSSLISRIHFVVLRDLAKRLISNEGENAELLKLMLNLLHVGEVCQVRLPLLGFTHHPT